MLEPEIARDFGNGDGLVVGVADRAHAHDLVVEPEAIHELTGGVSVGRPLRKLGQDETRSPALSEELEPSEQAAHRRRRKLTILLQARREDEYGIGLSQRVTSLEASRHPRRQRCERGRGPQDGKGRHAASEQASKTCRPNGRADESGACRNETAIAPKGDDGGQVELFDEDAGQESQGCAGQNVFPYRASRLRHAQSLLDPLRRNLPSLSLESGFSFSQAVRRAGRRGYGDKI